MNYKILSINRLVFFSVLLLFILTGGCTRNYSDINTDPTRLESLNTEDIKGLFTNAEYMAMYSGDGSAEYQYAQGFFADLYAQYSAITATFDPTDRYNITQEWIQEQWIGTFRAMAPLVNILKQTTDPEKITLNAIARIWKVWTIHRATDYYGPFPYKYIGYDSTVIPYDKQEDIYKSIQSLLDNAISDIAKNSLIKPGGEDYYYGGDMNKWKRLAYTLKARYYLHLTKAPGHNAQAQADLALSAIAMGMQADEDDFKFKYSGAAGAESILFTVYREFS